MSRMVSFLVLVAILVVISVLFFRVMSGFFIPLFLAALLVVVFQPLFRWTVEKCGGRRYVAAGIATFLVLLIVLIPAGLVIALATVQGISSVERLEVNELRNKLSGLRHELDLEIPHREDLDRVEDNLTRWKLEQAQTGTANIQKEMIDSNLLPRIDEIGMPPHKAAEADVEQAGPDIQPLRAALVALRDSAPFSLQRDLALRETDLAFRQVKRQLLGGSGRVWVKELANPTDEQIARFRSSVTANARSPLLSFGGGTLAIAGKTIFGLVIIVASTFFLFAESARMLDAAIRLSPLEERYVRELTSEFDRVCRAVVTATLLSAVVQGILAGIGFWVAGLSDSLALLMLLTMVLALVPFTGAASVWVPVSLYLYFVMGHTGSAFLLAAYGAVVISGADNVIKPLVLHGQSNLHPLLALLSVLGGIQALGPIGILVGPMIVVFLQTLLKILQRELLSLDRAQKVGASGGLLALLKSAGFAPPAPAASSSGPTEASITPPQMPDGDAARPPVAPPAGGAPPSTLRPADPPAAGSADKGRKRRK